MTSTPWTIPGAEGESILGDAHAPADGRRDDPRGVVLVAHGFKGYKDYGMFPRIARVFADAGFVAHRFNFSHSGMTNRLDTFERADLFERDTWNKQVEDLTAVVRAVAAGELAGGELPLILFGHSRGGVTVLLTAGRHADDAALPPVAGVITAAAPSRCNSLEDEPARLLLETGFLESPSARTGQTLRVGRVFLQEQIDDPAAHDLLALVARIRCPALIAHGTDDPTVPCASAGEIAGAMGAGARQLIIEGANHVFNTPNPMPSDAAPSAALGELLDGAVAFAVAAAGSPPRP